MTNPYPYRPTREQLQAAARASPSNFKNWPKDKLREVCRKAGKIAQSRGKARAWHNDTDDAKEAGRKGGQATQRKRRENQSNP